MYTGEKYSKTPRLFQIFGFQIGKKTKAKSRSNYQRFYSKRRNCKKWEAAKVSIPVSDETDLSNFYTELNSCKASVSLSLIHPFSETFVSKSRDTVLRLSTQTQSITISVRGMFKNISLAMQLRNTVANMRVLQFKHTRRSRRKSTPTFMLRLVVHLFIKRYPWLHATPDFLCYCTLM